METIARDLKHALRRLRRYPGFTLIAVLSLALGIGANTAIFSLVEALVFRDTGVHERERVLEAYVVSPDIPYSPFSIPDYRDLVKATSGVFSHSAGTVMTFVPRNVGDQIESLPAELVTGDYFNMLGLRPALGRLLSPADDVTPNGHPVLVLAHDYWKRSFNGDRAVIGQELRIDGLNYTIVGVAPAHYMGSLRAIVPAMYIPLMQINHLESSSRDALQLRGDQSTFVRARLKPGVSEAQARSVLATFAADMKNRYRENWPQNGQLKTVLLSDVIVSPMLDKFIKLGATLLTVVVVLVLLIACANLASFLLAQARDRQREIAIRLAIGAKRSTLVRQLLTESVCLALVGGVLGIVLAKGLVWVLFNTDLPLPVPVSIDARLNPVVLGFALLTTLAAGVLVGLAPALQATRTDVISTIKNENTGGGARRRVTLRDSLVIGQVGLSLVLLVMAGLFLRSMNARKLVDPGFGSQPTGLLEFNVSAQRFPEAQVPQFIVRLEERIQQIPGVQAVGVTSNLHLNPLSTQTMNINVAGLQPPEGQDAFTIDQSRVDAGFFSAAGITIARGRNFDAGVDRPATPKVAIINQHFADKFFPGRDPLGQTFRSDTANWTVIGVAANAKIRTPGEAARPFAYTHYGQRPNYFVTLLARTTGDADRLLPQLLTAAREVDPDLVVVELKTMKRHLGAMLLAAQLAAVIFGAFASLALVLALIGVYGVVSYAVARRKREVGIRLSLGARPGEVVGLLMKHGLTLVGIGGAIGLAVALAAAQLLRSALYGVQAIDPVTFTVGPLALFAIGALATWIPARRASQVDPARVLKSE